MNANPKLGKLRHRGAHIHHIATEAIELGDHQHVAGLQPVEQAREPAPLRGSDISGHGLGDHAAGLDLEARRLDLLQLIVRCLARGGDPEVGEGARHGRVSFEKDARNLPLSKRPSSYLLNRLPAPDRKRSDTVGEVLRP
jgi:hypothetical protein